MSLREVRTDVTFGPIVLRLELIPIAIGLAVISGIAYGVAFVLAVAVHELGHLLAARALGLGAEKLVLQVTGGGTYVRGDDATPRTKILVLLAGPFASLLLAFVALTARTLGAGGGMFELFYMAGVWTVYQLMPFPPLDGGQLLRIVLAGRVPSATAAWRIGWALGLAIAVGLVLIDFGNLQAVVLLTGMALVLGRAESGYVRHLDAYAAWQRGDHRAVVARVLKLPDYLEREDKAKLHELGLFSAMELGDAAAVEVIAQELPSLRVVVLAAAEWLLARNNATGARLAQRALDTIDQDLAKPTPAEKERLADTLVVFAAFEARELRPDSALGLLERAVDLGFAHPDRLEADGDLRALAEHPRMASVLERARASG